MIAVVRYRRLRKHLNPLQDATRELFKLGNHPRRIKIFKSDKLQSPMVYGLFQPFIVLPADWRSWKTDMRRAIIFHELEHIRRGDHWINMLCLLALASQFFNPLVWILIDRIQIFGEMVCDDAAVKGSSAEQKERLSILKMPGKPVFRERLW